MEDEDMEDLAMECLKADIVRHFEKTPKDIDRAVSWFDENGRAYMVGVTKAESNEFEIPEHCEDFLTDSFEALLRCLLPPTIAEGLIGHEDDPVFVADSIRKYLEGDKFERARMLKEFGDKAIKEEDGTPTAADLEEMLKQSTEEKE